MERITLEEAIKYIKEVVCKNRKNKEKNTIVIPNSFISSADCAEKYEQVAKWLKELKSYKEAEEQGLLVRLPCKVGEDVYGVNSYVGCDNDKCDDLYSSVHCFNCKFEKEFYYIQKIKFNFDNLDDVGRTIFITKEEAEKKLEEMKK